MPYMHVGTLPPRAESTVMLAREMSHTAPLLSPASPGKSDVVKASFISLADLKQNDFFLCGTRGNSLSAPDRGAAGRFLTKPKFAPERAKYSLPFSASAHLVLWYFCGLELPPDTPPYKLPRFRSSLDNPE